MNNSISRVRFDRMVPLLEEPTLGLAQQLHAGEGLLRILNDVEQQVLQMSQQALNRIAVVALREINRVKQQLRAWKDQYRQWVVYAFEGTHIAKSQAAVGIEQGGVNRMVLKGHHSLEPFPPR